MECDNCGVCCKNPGLLLPADLNKIQDYLGIKSKELLDKYLILLLIKKDESWIYAIAPRKKRRKDRVVGYNYNLSNKKCVFWKKGCVINEVKPYGCSVLVCNKMSDKEVTQDYGKLLEKWSNSQETVYEIIPKLRNVKSLTELSKLMKCSDITIWFK